MTDSRPDELASDDRLRLFVEHAPAAIAMVDREMRYLAVSRRWLTDYRLDDVDVIGRSHYELFPEVPEHWKDVHRRCLAGAVEKNDEDSFVRADGRTDWLKWEIHPWRTAAGEVGGLMLFTEVITGRKEAELALQQRAKLESIGRLAGGVAHDFNNLLTVVLSCAQALKDDLEAGRLPAVADVEEISIAGRRAAELTRQLLTFARKQVVAPVQLDLNTVIANAKKLLSRVLGERYDIEETLSPALWPIRCDAVQLEQVILNLAVNARDAMPLGGTLHFETANVKAAPAQLPSGEYVRFAVRDTGVGMTADVRQHAFDPFFTTKPLGQGTGLGLATVYGVVEQAGGALAVDSAPGRGTTVEIYLPRDAGPAAEPVSRVSTSPRGAESVLVVEDDALVRKVIARTLTDAGYEVLAFASGDAALAAIEHERAAPDLVVTDVVMPGLDGTALAAAIRECDPSVRVLFVSGYSEDVIGARSVLHLGVDFLAKPFTPESLLERVRAVLETPPERA